MPTENSSSSQVSAASGGLTPLIQLADLLGGQKQTVSSSANINPLQQVLGSLRSQDYSQQLGSILQAVAGQTPGLAARYSNAVGARSGSNAPLAASLDKLMVDAALKGQNQIAQLQNQNLATQAQAAQGIAQATRGTQMQTGTNLGRAATGIAALKLGQDLMQSDLGKRAAAGAENALNSLSSYFEPQATSASGDIVNNYIDSAASGGWAQNMYDVGQLFDGASLFSNANTAYDTQDVVNLWDSVGFADGGLVGRDGNTRTVRSSGGRRSSAPTYQADPVKRAMSGASTSDTAQSSISPSTSSSTQEAQPESNVTPGQALSIAMSTATGNVPGLLATIADVALSQSQGKAVSIAAPAVAGLTSNNPIAQAIALGKAALGLFGLSAGAAGTEGPGIGVSSVGPGFGGNSIAGVSLADSSSAAVGPMSVAPGMNSSISGLTGETASVGDSSASAGAGISDGFGEAGFGGTSSASPGGMKSGGEVKGPGTGTSDSVHTRLSDGEYVVPADVVQRLGVSFFDKLRAQFHAPVAK